MKRSYDALLATTNLAFKKHRPKEKRSTMTTAENSIPETAAGQAASSDNMDTSSAPEQMKMKEGSEIEPKESTDTTSSTAPATGTSSDDKGDIHNETTRATDDTTTKMETTADKSTTETTFGASQSLPALNPWDHSSRRIVVNNVTKFLDGKKLKKEADKWAEDCSTKGDTKIVIEKLRKPPRDAFMIVTLAEEAMVAPFLEYIEQTHIKNRKGFRITAKRVIDKNNNHHGSNDGDDRKRKDRDAAFDDDLERYGKAGVQRRHRDEIAQRARRPITRQELYQKVTPLYQLSPEAQAKQKFMEMIRKCALAMGKEIKSRFKQLQKKSDRKKNDAVYAWLKNDRCIPVQNLQTVPSPLRNKVEYTFGYRYVYDDDDDNEKAEPETKDATMADAETASSDQTSNNDQQSTNQNGSDNPKKDEEDAKSKAESNGAEKEDTRKVKKIPSAGFMVTGWSGGVCKPQGCANISSEMSAICDIFEDFLQDRYVEGSSWYSVDRCSWSRFLHFQYYFMNYTAVPFLSTTSKRTRGFGEFLPFVFHEGQGSV